MTTPETGADQPPKRKLSDFISADHLKIIADPKLGGGFSFREDPNLPPDSVGYTDMRTKVIHINPLHLETLPRTSILGFVYHEAGHHAPPVVVFQDKVIESLSDERTIPPSYKGDPETEKRFAQTVWANLGNSLADIWLESYLSRRPYFPVRTAIEDLYTTSNTWESGQFPTWSKPKQFLQSILYLRHDPRQVALGPEQNTRIAPQLETELQGNVDPEVYETVLKVYKTGAMAAVLDRRSFENYFATDSANEATVERKFQAYLQVFLPEYLKLVEAEVQERQEQKKGQKRQQGSGSGDGGTDSSTPLTKAEEQEVIEQLLKELEADASSHQTQTLSKEEMEHINKQLREAGDKIQQRGNDNKDQKQKGQTPDQVSGLESLMDRAMQTLLQEAERRRRGLSESLGIRQESVRRWEDTKREKSALIESTASSLAEVFLEDRRAKIEYLMREGEVVPGLETETITAILTGDLDPKTRMRVVKNPEFLETELEFIVDRSGSMSGAPIEKSTELMIVVTEALKRVEEDLAGEDLLREDEHPLRVGVTTFSKTPERVSKLSEPLTDQKGLIIVDKVSRVGGGTDESEAIEGVYREMTLGAGNVLKIIIILTDGYGNKDAVQPIIRQVEEDNEVIFLAVGVGMSEEQNQGIVDTYLTPLQKPGQESNVFGIVAPNPEAAMPQIIDFIKGEVNKRARPR